MASDPRLAAIPTESYPSDSASLTRSARTATWVPEPFANPSLTSIPRPICWAERNDELTGHQEHHPALPIDAWTRQATVRVAAGRNLVYPFKCGAAIHAESYIP